MVRLVEQPMTLPPELLQAVSAPGGGKLSLVIGAGCSIEPPTCVPITSDCSKEVHRRLVADGVLNEGDCANPCDLSLVADAVFAKGGTQRPVVERFSAQYDLKSAAPNSGHEIAAAMLSEGVISSVVTLNFDLALSNALSHLGVGQVVGIIDCPDHLGQQKGRNLYYLHRNVNAVDPDLWVLRSAALKDEWKGHWESIIATKVLTSPIVVLVGLGTPISVLVETVSLIRNALPKSTGFYLVDPIDRSMSTTFAALKIDEASYIKQKWCGFMEAISNRLVEEQLHLLSSATTQMAQENKLPAEDITCLMNRLSAIGLVNLGKVRSAWLFHEKPYAPDDEAGRYQIGDLLLAACYVARVSNAEVEIADDGLVEFRRDGRVLGAYALASGRGYRGRAAIEARIEHRRSQYRRRAVAPLGVIVGGTSDAWGAEQSPPEDVVRGGATNDIVSGTLGLRLYHIAELRNDPKLIAEVVP